MVNGDGQFSSELQTLSCSKSAPPLDSLRFEESWPYDFARWEVFETPTHEA